MTLLISFGTSTIYFVKMIRKMIRKFTVICFKIAELYSMLLCLNRCLKGRIHSSKVQTDHFSNSLSEKTTNDIPIKFSQCHFKSPFYRLPFLNRGFYLQIIYVRRKAVFMFYRTCIACINNITFQFGYLQDSERPHKNNRKYCAAYNQDMQYTVLLNNGRLN